MTGWIIAGAAIYLTLVKTTRWWSALVDDPERPSPRRWTVVPADDHGLPLRAVPDEDGPTGRWDPAHATEGLAASVTRDRIANQCPCDHHAGLCARSCACRRTSFPWGAA